MFTSSVQPIESRIRFINSNFTKVHKPINQLRSLYLLQQIYYFMKQKIWVWITDIFLTVKRLILDNRLMAGCVAKNLREFRKSPWCCPSIVQTLASKTNCTDSNGILSDLLSSTSFCHTTKATKIS